MEQYWQVPKAECHELKPRETKYCVIIPVINEGERIKQQLLRMKTLTGVIDLILADGGSSDGSTDLLYLKSVGVRALLVKKDKGKLSAQLRMGFAYALEQGYKGIITVDGNNKDGVEAIPNFIKELDAGFDFVQGSRYVPGGKAINTPKVRDFAIKIIHAPIISLVAKERFTDTTNGFRAFSSKYLLDPRVQPFRDIFDTYEILAYLSVRASQLGLKTKEIPVIRKYPDDGKVPTKISGIKGNISLMKILAKLMLKNYNPKNDTIHGKKGSHSNA
ncbi:glycosyltransferase family 2 protein [Neobacillus sp. OS1-2]|uniref:glycosyltransferase family 2 protein n=1 Tax=Neobacillus sp. OS1-2 TaxID=3070680 RepID=UPI0027DFF87A|nr:glycosyltransferase family 2 protein [Neobacillus sp. OS1-2]WML41235.1 glycosyltransferase family 2 protein [Neobacillus sp. OS1-2]